MSFSSPGLLTGGYNVDTFDCGRESLNLYLRRFALTNTASGVAKTYVTTVNGDVAVIGYYSLAAGSVDKTSVPQRIAQGLPKYPVPVILLARWAVDRRYQAHGLGKSLLQDAIRRSLSAADLIGVRALLVHAIDQAAADRYSRYGFRESPTDPLHLMILIKDLRHNLG